MNFFRPSVSCFARAVFLLVNREKCNLSVIFRNGIANKLSNQGEWCLIND